MKKLLILALLSSLLISCGTDEVSENVETTAQLVETSTVELSTEESSLDESLSAPADPDEVLQAQGIFPEEGRYRFITSLLSGDSAVLEELLGMPEGMGDCFKTLKFGSWSVSIDEDYESKSQPFDESMRPVELTVEIVESEMATLPVGVHKINIHSDWYYCEVAVSITTTNRIEYVPLDEQSAAYRALNSWLSVNGMDITLGDPETEEEKERAWSDIGDYLSCYCGVRELSDYKEFAEICFGVTDFEPCAPLIQADDGTYYAGGHGGTILEKDFISETENADGTVSIVIKYYADYNGLIESELVEYVMRDTGEVYGEYPIYAFEKVNVTPLSEYESFGHIL